MITSSPGTAVDDALRAAVGHGVGGEGRWPHEPLEPDEFDRLLVTAMSERLLGVLAEAVADGALSLPSEQLEQLTHLHAGSQAHMLEIERLLLRVIERFGELGIEYRVLKGVALAHLVYADPAWRVAADVDLLVRGDRLADAIRIAVDEFGGDQLVPELRPGFDREFGKESMVRVGNVELDLHRTFVVGPFGLTIELADLFTEANTITVGERRLIALGTEHLFLHACYNVALGDYPVRWGSVHDLLLCAKHLPIDLDRAIAIAQRWQGTAVVRRAAEVAVDMGGGDAEFDFRRLAGMAVPRRQEWLLRSYLTPARSYSRPLTSLVVISGIRARLRYARAIVAPSATYLRSRGWTGRAHLRRAITQLSHRE